MRDRMLADGVEARHREAEDERLAFLDRAAMAALNGLLCADSYRSTENDMAHVSYSYAEALWTERERRRTAKP